MIDITDFDPPEILLEPFVILLANDAINEFKANIKSGRWKQMSPEMQAYKKYELQVALGALKECGVKYSGSY